MSELTNTEVDSRYIGGQIPSELFWEFKKIVAERHETQIEALENAIRMYIELKPESEE